jgi:site-specific DNA-methyltransferase (adenine-specific)|tara:strand:+ start:2727 stop:3245 length:519 start_codon:yes stop_codon:yes gene_type:complete
MSQLRTGLWKQSLGAVGFSSASSEWDTPQGFYDKLDKQFNFTLDPCATSKSAKCKKYYTEEDDGLAQDWKGQTVFVNPPYGRGIGVWLKKGYEESKKHNTVVVMLIPSRTDTKWWHDYVMKAKEVHLVRGRLKFGTSANAAPFPSAVVVFHSDMLYKSPVALAPDFYPLERT